MQSVHRARFLEELVKSFPSQRAHFNKRVEYLEEKPDGPVVIHFKDGTTATADAVIGADGVHSTVRAHLLGKEAAKPVFAGSVAYRALVPMDKAVEKLGEEFAQNSFFMCGRGMLPASLLNGAQGAEKVQDLGSISYPIDGGSILNIVIFDFAVETWEHEKWVIPADPETLRSKFSTWGASSRALVEVSLPAIIKLSFHPSTARPC